MGRGHFALIHFTLELRDDGAGEFLDRYGRHHLGFVSEEKIDRLSQGFAEGLEPGKTDRNLQSDLIRQSVLCAVG